jgi:hypothetical protein
MTFLPQMTFASTMVGQGKRPVFGSPLQVNWAVVVDVAALGFQNLEIYTHRYYW